MSSPLVILAGKGGAKRYNPKIERPDDYHTDGLGHRYKPIDIKILERPLIDWALEAYSAPRLNDGSPHFHPIYIAGPSRKYKEFFKTRKGVDIKPLETDGYLHENLENISHFLLKHHPHSFVMLVAGDLLPTEKDVKGLAQLHSKHEESIDAFYPVVLYGAIKRLGIEKPKYGGVDQNGKKIEYTFSQVYALRPSQVRWDLITLGARIAYARRMKGAYQSFNKGMLYTMLIGSLLKPRNVRAVPFLLQRFTRFSHALQEVRKGTISVSEAEEFITGLLLRNEPKRKEARRTVIEITKFTSLAFDVDRESERRQLEKILTDELDEVSSGA